MIEISTPAGELLMIEVPEGATDFHLRYPTYPEPIELIYWIELKREKIKFGDYRNRYAILGTLSPDGKIDFEVSHHAVESECVAPGKWLYRDYSRIDQPIFERYSAKDSFLTLLQSHLKPDDAGKRYVVLKREI